MELRHVKYFIAVAEELHFGKAARRLHIAQPPLSTQIKQLEEEFGTPLFSRSSHHVQLTQAGQLFLVEARKLLEQAEFAVQSAKRAGRGEAGTLVIGYVEEALHIVLPTILNRFRERYPEVECRLREMHSNQQACALRDGEIDFSFGYSRNDDPLLHNRSVASGGLLLAMARGHRLAGKRTIGLASLHDEAFIFPERDSSPDLHDYLMTVCVEQGLVPRIAQHAIHIYSVMGLVRAGVGMTLFPAFLRAEEWTDCVFVKIYGKPINLDMFMTWQRTNDRCAAASHFLTVVQESLVPCVVGVKHRSKPRSR